MINLVVRVGSKSVRIFWTQIFSLSFHNLSNQLSTFLSLGNWYDDFSLSNSILDGGGGGRWTLTSAMVVHFSNWTKRDWFIRSSSLSLIHQKCEVTFEGEREIFFLFVPNFALFGPAFSNFFVRRLFHLFGSHLQFLLEPFVGRCPVLGPGKTNKKFSYRVKKIKEDFLSAECGRSEKNNRNRFRSSSYRRYNTTGTTKTDICWNFLRDFLHCFGRKLNQSTLLLLLCAPLKSKRDFVWQLSQLCTLLISTGVDAHSGKRQRRSGLPKLTHLSRKLFGPNRSVSKFSPVM